MRECSVRFKDCFGNGCWFAMTGALQKHYHIAQWKPVSQCSHTLKVCFTLEQDIGR